MPECSFKDQHSFMKNINQKLVKAEDDRTLSGSIILLHHYSDFLSMLDLRQVWLNHANILVFH